MIQFGEAEIGKAEEWIQWEIKLDPRTGTLDLEGLRRREFIKFITGLGRID